ncbi:MAG: hypothetical protein LC720_01235 [Actinobacteria bacterium]|nr:hypothetical protein [Actinomycetota bacterium]
MTEAFTAIASATSRTAGNPMSLWATLAIIFGTLILVCLVIAGIWFVTAKLGSRQPTTNPKPPPSTQ